MGQQERKHFTYAWLLLWLKRKQSEYKKAEIFVHKHKRHHSYQKTRRYKQLMLFVSWIFIFFAAYICNNNNKFLYIFFNKKILFFFYSFASFMFSYNAFCTTIYFNIIFEYVLEQCCWTDVIASTVLHKKKLEETELWVELPEDFSLINFVYLLEKIV